MTFHMSSVHSGQLARLKIIMVGESGVGKTCLLERLECEDDVAVSECEPTVGTDLKVVEIDIDGKNVSLFIWDTSGQERYNSLCPGYFRNAQGVVLVYDITRRITFEKLTMWWENITTYAPESTGIIVVGNKIDLENRQVTREEGLQFARGRKVLFLETTSKTSEGISHIFEKLVRKILPHASYPKPDMINLSPYSYDVAVSTERSCWEKWC